jgi:hypothetical protein
VDRKIDIKDEKNYFFRIEVSSINHDFEATYTRRQGILSVPGIARYKRVPARIGCFYKDKIFFFS